MAKQLPFKTTPKEEFAIVGNEETGTLQIPKKNSLTVKEKLAVENGIDSVNFEVQIAQLAQEIADTHANDHKENPDLAPVDIQLAYDVARSFVVEGWEEQQWEEVDALTSLQTLKDELLKDYPEKKKEINSSLNKIISTARTLPLDKKQKAVAKRVKTFNDLRFRYTEQLTSIMKDLLNNTIKKKQVAVTAIVQSRLDPDWSQEDTISLDEPIYEELWEFACNEMNGWEDQPTEPTPPPTEEEIKKSPEEKEQLALTA